MIYFITNQVELFDSYPAHIQRRTLNEMITDIKDVDILAIDTETEGFDPYTNNLIYVQIGDSINQYVIDISTVSIKSLKNLLESKTLIMHNAKFDLRFFFHQGIYPTKVFDTFLAETVLTTGMIKPPGYRGLDGCLRRYQKVQLQKEVRGLIHRERYSTRVLEYSAADVEHLHNLMDSQLLALDNNDLLKCISLENKFVVVLAYIEYCGIYLDTLKWKQKMEEDLNKLSLLIREMEDWVKNNLPGSSFINTQLSLFDDSPGCLINWNSSSQVIKLFQEIGINTYDAKEDKHTVDIKILYNQIDKFEFLKIYIEYSKVFKLVSSFGESILKAVNPVTRRIHTSFRQIKDTGRLSCGDKKRNAPNLQQIPSDDRHRSCFVAEPSNSIIVCDYASQESRILADLSKDPDLVKFYLEGGADLHSYAAKVVYKELSEVPLDDIKVRHKDKRQIMKGFNFALAYGGTGETVSRNLNIPIDIAKQAEIDYFKAFSGLKSYFEIAKKKPVKNGYVLIDKVSGRKSFIDFYPEYQRLETIINKHGFWEEYRFHKNGDTQEFANYYKPTVREYFKLRGIMERKGLNYVIQGTAASQTKYAGIKLFKWIMENNYFGVIKIVNLVHDEIVVECPSEMEDEVAKQVQTAMEEGANAFMEIIPMYAEPEVSNHWKK